MPLYEYHCRACGKNFEVRQKFADAPLKTHEECGGEVERLLSAPALHFKGSGWYVTDYAKNGKSPSTTSHDSKSESKPAETKSSETKPAESKSSDTKPAPAA